MPNSDRAERQVPILFYVTAEEKQIICARAKNSGMSISAYIRDCTIYRKEK